MLHEAKKRPFLAHVHVLTTKGPRVRCLSVHQPTLSIYDHQKIQRRNENPLTKIPIKRYQSAAAGSCEHDHMTISHNRNENASCCSTSSTDRMKSFCVASGLVLGLLVPASMGQGILQVHGSGTTNPSKCYWSIVSTCSCAGVLEYMFYVHVHVF